jgi:hypothetical protein
MNSQPGALIKIRVSLVMGCLVVVSLVRTLTHQILFADGSFFEYTIITSKKAYTVSDRSFVQWIQQGAALLLRLSGLTHNTKYLTLALGFGYFIVPTLLLIFLLWKFREDAILTLMNLSVGLLAILVSGGMVGESGLTSILVLAFVNLCFMKKGNSSKKIPFILLFLSLVLSKSYESMAFFGLILAICLFQKFRDASGEKFIFSRFIHWLTILILISDSFLSFKRTVFPRDLANRNQAFDFKYLSQSYGAASFFLIPLISIVVGLLIYRSGHSKPKKSLSISILIFFMIFYLFSTRAQLAIGFDYYFRLISAVLVGLILILVLISQFKFSRFLKRIQLPLMDIILFSILLTSVQCLNTSIGWNSYQSRVQQIIFNKKRVQPYQNLGYVYPTDSQFSWSWSMPTLSYVLRSSNSDGLLANPGESSFNPLDTRSIPDSDGFFWTR